MHALATIVAEQSRRNAALLADTPLLGARIESHVLPFAVDLATGQLSADQNHALAALEKTAATIAIKSLVSLGKAGDIDHLGGGLELIPALLMTLGIVDYERRHYVIEHGHTSIGYYAALAALGFLTEDRVIDKFRRSLDIAGHVSWVPGGTPLGSGRLGVMMPVGTGLALGLKAKKGNDAFVVCHCGDAGWISGQALNGFVAASVHKAPIAFVMHRNGIQLSGTTKRIMDKDPRPIVASLGIEILEIPSLHDRANLARTYSEAFAHAQSGRPVMIYPVGYGGPGAAPVTVADFGRMYDISSEVAKFATDHGVALDTQVRIPGSLMSFRDPQAMIQCLFLVNELPGGEGHHDGGMKGRDGAAVLANPLLALSAEEQTSLRSLQDRPRKTVITEARPPKGTPNLTLTHDDVKGIQLPGTDKWVTPRAGSEVAYAAVAKKYPDSCFFVSCDLNPSTKLAKAADLVLPTHRFEMSIEEQASALMTDGLSFAGRDPQLNVFATFGAFLEGIAREGFEMWRYQRNLNGLNEGLNVLMHFSHVGACTGRDHFSGWSLDWLNLSLAYMPFLRRFYAPADARAAFLAVRDAAAEYGGHIVAIPRDNLPVLTKTGSSEPLWSADEPWTAVTRYRQHEAAEVAVLSVGAPTYLAGGASDKASVKGINADVYVINGFPLPDGFLDGLARRYKKIVTIEDGLIGTLGSGLRGFAGYVASGLYGSQIALDHFGIADPQIAPSDHFVQVWEHYGLTEEGILNSILG
jgi:transketolase N-terminal domain/subunit/transketolase C-terminal domain/subunit